MTNVTNNVFLKLLRDVLVKSLADISINNVLVRQNFPSKKTETPNEPFVVFHRISDEPMHWQSRKAKVINSQKVIVHEQQFITTLQVNAFMPRVAPEKESINDLSSEDLLRYVHMILQSQRMLDACKQAELGLLPILNITPNWVQDEHDNWINEPSFNLEITSKQQLVWNTPVVESGKIRIERV